MFSALVRLHWKSARAWVIAAMVAVASLPVISVAAAWPTDPNDLATFLARLDAWSLFYPAVAVVLGIVMAALTWRSDRRGDFIYALTLPIERWRYVLYRFGAGAIWILAVTAALWVAGWITVLVTPRAELLHAYPNGLALKFALATVAMFSVAFAIGGLPAQTRRVASRLILAVIAVQALVLLLGLEGNWLVPAVEALTDRLGPLGLLAGRWMLIDV